MITRSHILLHSASSLFKRYHSGQSLPDMLAAAKRLADEKHYKSAQNQYKKIMDTYPNYAEAYDQYFHLHLKTVGPFGLKQSMYNHLQKKYHEAVAKYGEYKDEPPPSPKV